MALPATLNPSAPANSDSPSQGDDQIRALKQLIADLFGFPTDPTPLTAAPFSITAAGVITVGVFFRAGSASTPGVPTREGTTGMFSPGTGIVGLSAAGDELFRLTQANPTTATFTSPAANAGSLVMALVHGKTSTSNGDTTHVFQFHSKDSGNTSRIIAQISVVHDDVTAASQDSSMTFSVQSNANAAGANTTATLSSLGVWTDASSEKIKHYEGDIPGVLGKLRKLSTLGVYRRKDTPASKVMFAERHYSPTAEEFWKVFGLGTDPATSEPGIAPKDVGWLGVKGLLELEARVAKLEGK